MESILAAICVVSLLAAITAWTFAWKMHNDWKIIVKELRDGIRAGKGTSRRYKAG